MTTTAAAIRREFRENSDARTLLRTLRRIAWRLLARRAMRQLVRSAIVALALASVVLLAHEVGLVSDPRQSRWLAILALGVAVSVVPALRPIGPRQAASSADAACGLGERLTTAVDVVTKHEPMMRLVVRDAARAATAIDVQRVARVTPGREIWLMAGGTIVTVALWLHRGSSEGPLHRSAEQRPPVASDPAHPERVRPVRAQPGDAARRDATLREILRTDGDVAPSSDIGATSAMNTSSRPADATGERSGAVRAPGSSRPDTVAGNATADTAASASDPSSATSGSSVPGERSTATAPAAADARGVRGQTISRSDAERATAPGGGTAASRAGGDPNETGRHRPADAGHVVAAGPAGMARTPMLPALRRYVERYFDELTSTRPMPDRRAR